MTFYLLLCLFKVFQEFSKHREWLYLWPCIDLQNVTGSTSPWGTRRYIKYTHPGSAHRHQITACWPGSSGIR